MEEILQHSDIAPLMHHNKIDALLMTGKCLSSHHRWAVEHSIRLIVTPLEQQQYFENKITFDRYLDEHHIPKPASEIGKFPTAPALLDCGKTVIQIADSWGGEGTFFIQNETEWNDLCQQFPSPTSYLARSFIHGISYGITVFICADHIALSPLRSQCFYDLPQLIDKTPIFAGIQWIPSQKITAKAKTNLNQVFQTLGQLMHQSGYRGYANFDFIISEKQEIYLIECNARFSAAVTQIIHFPHELLSGVNSLPIFINEQLDPKPYARNPTIHPFPSSSYEGAFLQIQAFPHLTQSPFVVRNLYPTGICRLLVGQINFIDPNISKLFTEKDFFVFSPFSHINPILTNLTMMANIISNFPLFDDNTRFNTDAKTILSYFDFAGTS